MAKIPVFKPSGLGLMADLKNIKVSEIMSWGAYKGKLKKKQKEVCGTFIDKDGVECYNLIYINQYASQPESETYKLLELFGVKDEDFTELANAWNDNDLAYIRVGWEGQGRPTENAFEFWLSRISEIMSEVTHFDISGTIVKYKESSYPLPENRQPKYVFNDTWGITPSSTNNSVERNDFGTSMWTTTPTLEIVNSSMLTEALVVNLWNDTVDISADFPDEFKKMLIAICLMSPNSAFTKTSNSSSESAGSPGFIDVFQTERYDNVFDKTFFTGKFLEFTVDDPDKTDPAFRVITNFKGIPLSTFGSIEYYPYYWAEIWRGEHATRSENLYQLTDELFKFTQERVSAELGGFKLSEYDVRMTVDGLRKSTHKNFGFYVSQFMKVESKEEDKGWFINFIVGLVDFFLSLIDAFLNFLEVIPIISDMIELILDSLGKIFGISYEEMRAIFRAVIKAIIIAIAVYYAPVLVGEVAGAAGGTAANVLAGIAGGAMTIPQMLSVALDMYSLLSSSTMAMKEVEKEKQEELEQRNIEAELTPEAQAFAGTLGSREQHEGTDELMYNLMFNPLESLIHGELPPIFGENKKEK